MLEAARRNKFIARHWVEAFNTKALERLLALYWEEAEHFSPRLLTRRPETKGLITGKAELRAWYTDALAIPTLHYEPTSITADDDAAFLKYLRTVADEEDTQISETFKIVRGKIIASRVESIKPVRTSL